MNYYFAYGSNMNQLQMKERCPTATLVSRVVLKDYKIDFTIYSEKRQCGCADIVSTKSGEVWGLLYTVSDLDIQALDTFEGHPIHYRRCEVVVYDDFKVSYVAISYEVVTKQQSTLSTSKHYLGLLHEAALQHNFPESYLKTLTTFCTVD
jgi:gamma-glutamylcyclotransferase (GGCT)/AIG2-like uncharacterized protein YtfP